MSAWVLYLIRGLERSIKDVSTQGEERIDHVWMKVWTELDQRNEGMEKTERNETQRD